MIFDLKSFHELHSAHLSVVFLSGSMETTPLVHSVAPATPPFSRAAAQGLVLTISSPQIHVIVCFWQPQPEPDAGCPGDCWVTMAKWGRDKPGGVA